MTIPQYLYKDMDFNFTKSSNNGLLILTSEETIKQDIKNLLLTNIGYGNKFEEAEYGSGISNLLSEKPTKFVALEIRDHIETTINNYEPRITLNDVIINYEKESYSFIVTIIYTIININLTQSLTINLNVIS